MKHTMKKLLAALLACLLLAGSVAALADDPTNDNEFTENTPPEVEGDLIALTGEGGNDESDLTTLTGEGGNNENEENIDNTSTPEQGLEYGGQLSAPQGALSQMAGMDAAPADGNTTYTLTIPSTLTVSGSGWNATDGISATGSLADGKRLTVTATSANNWALKSSDNSVDYTLTTAEGGSQTTSWEFTTLDGTAKPMGIIVEDYSSKPAGTYTDTVTFTASVVSATKKLTLKGEYFDDNTKSFVQKSLEIEYTDNDTWKDIAERYDEVSLRDSSFGPEGKIVMFWRDMNQRIDGCELKSKESTYNYYLVSINDKVSAYSSYYLQ